MRTRFALVIVVAACGGGLDTRGLSGPDQGQSPQTKTDPPKTGETGTNDPDDPTGSTGQTSSSGSSGNTGSSSSTGASGQTGDTAGAKPVVCPQGTGVKLSAPWPVHGYCPDEQGRSSANGPLTKPRILWEKNFLFRWIFDPVVDSDGTVYTFVKKSLQAPTSKIVGYTMDGTEVVNQDLALTPVAPPILGANGVIYTIGADTCGNVSCRSIIKYDTATKTVTTFSAPGARSLTLMPNGNVAIVSEAGRVWQTTPTGGATACDQTLAALDIHAGNYGLGVRPNGLLVVRGEGALRLVKQDCTLDKDLPTETWFHFTTLLSAGYLFASGVADTYFGIYDYSGARNSFDYGYTRGAAEQPAVDADGTIRVGYNRMADPVGDNSLIDGKIVRYSASGSKGWTVTIGVLVDTQPTLGADGTVYAATYEGKVYGIAANGVTRWDFDVGSSINNTQMAIGLGNMLFVATEDGHFYALAP